MSQLPRSVDVAIIGGGFAGAATAWALRRLGITNVIILEREAQLGRFASGRSAGLGRQLAEDNATTELTVRGASLLRSMPGVWAPTGGVLSFDDADHAAAYLARAQTVGVSATPGDRELAAKHWPELAGMRCMQTLWVPSDGVIAVAAPLHTLVEGTPVALSAGVQRIESGPRVVTARGAIAARVVVDASGAWAGEVTGAEPLTSIKRHVFVLDADGEADRPWLWHVGASEMYVRVEGDSVLASPCDAAPSSPGHQDPDLVGEAHMRRLFDAAESSLATAPITRRWACQRAFTEDRKMRLGRDPARPWLVWAVGLGGHGATAAPAVGEKVAAAVVRALG